MYMYICMYIYKICSQPFFFFWMFIYVCMYCGRMCVKVDASNINLRMKTWYDLQINLRTQQHIPIHIPLIGVYVLQSEGVNINTFECTYPIFPSGNTSMKNSPRPRSIHIAYGSERRDDEKERRSLIRPCTHATTSEKATCQCINKHVYIIKIYIHIYIYMYSYTYIRSSIITLRPYV